MITHGETRQRASARTAMVVVLALVFIVWTIAAVFTLVYWSGLELWVLGAITLAGFVWILKVFLRPSAPQHDT